MKLKILRIENEVVTCELEDGQIIDIARRWFPKQLHEEMEYDIDVTECNA